MTDHANHGVSGLNLVSAWIVAVIVLGLFIALSVVPTAAAGWYHSFILSTW